jgi:hypothetical protein
MEVFGQDSGGVLHRHGIAGEGNHSAPKLPVQAAKWCLVQGICFGHGSPDRICGVS